MGLLSIAERFKDKDLVEALIVRDGCTADSVIKECRLDAVGDIVCPVLKLKFCYYNNCRYWNGIECGKLS